ncbi:MAG: LysM peptidoglycan-binding domain-containing protein [Lachnospiraceae bacterium]|nr:LysM peptidoglycan-binding domain-containing protein [Lachnospiraceae bacterium]
MTKGIDISHHQGDIDWSQAKNEIGFVMIRTGYGVSSPSQVDKKFIQHIEGAKRNGIPVGVYHYSYASSPLEASKEASFCLDIVKDYQLEYPVAYDIEDVTIAKLTKRQKTDMVISFCDKIESAGYYAMFYCNPNWANNHLYADELFGRYDFWLAHYGVDSPSIACGMWQKTDTGKIAGIKGNVDIDIAYKDYQSIIKTKGLNRYSGVKPYNVYIVSKGDTLWDIAVKYYGDGTKWTEIYKYNNLASDKISIGQILKIPN